MSSSNGSNVPRTQEFLELLNDYYLCTKNGMPTRIIEIVKEILHETECKDNVSCSACLIYDYCNLIKMFLESHVNYIQTKGLDLSGEELLSFYKDRCENFESASRRLDDICYELYEHFQNAEHTFSFHRIYRLAITAWDLHTAGFTGDVTDTVFKMIDDERRGKKVNKSLIEVTMRLLKANVRLKNIGRPLFIYSKLDPTTYLDEIEDRYINTTYSFYRRESVRLLNKNSVIDYLNKAINIIFTEQFNCANAYLMPPDVVKYITLSLSQVFIHDHNFVLTTYINRLLNDYEITSLRQIYFYLKAVPDPRGLKIFSKTLCNNIKSNGRQIMEQCFSKDGINSKLYIEKILKMRRIYSDLVRITFQSEEEFEKAYTRATRYIVNNIPSETNSTAETAKLLASHCINVLKKPQTRAFYPIDDLRLLFQCLEDKYIFEEEFYQLLASCLMWETPKDLILFKRETITFVELFSDATRNFTPDQIIKGMIKDIETSSDLTNDFRNVEQTQETDTRLHFKILRKEIWPFVEKKLPITISEGLSYQVELFSQFYKIKNTRRKLTWLYHLFEAELQSHCFEKEHLFNLDTVQTAVLLKFNDANRWSLEQLQRDTRIEKQLLNQAIETFIEANILITKSEENSQDSGDDWIVEINFNYKNKETHVRLTKLHQQTQETTIKKNDYTISEENKFYAIQAAVIRIIKRKLAVKHEELVADVFKDMNSKFDFNPALLDKSIDKLISRNFIERSKEDCNQYNYIP